jgi:hypothetical protein
MSLAVLTNGNWLTGKEMGVVQKLNCCRDLRSLDTHACGPGNKRQGTRIQRSCHIFISTRNVEEPI